jgi:hypothetical protein
MAEKLSVGAIGAEVTRLHEELQRRKFEVPAPEMRRKFFGPGTREAVLACQRQHGLACSGEVDESTAALLAGNPTPRAGGIASPGATAAPEVTRASPVEPNAPSPRAQGTARPTPTGFGGLLPGDPPAMTDLAYALTGQFFELCDCYTICPCWVGQAPNDDRCTGAFGWSVITGEINGLDVSGRRVVSVSFHTGHRNEGGQEVYVFVDDGADDDQYRLLVGTFTGRHGGPLGELGRLMGVLRHHERAPIELTAVGDDLSVTVGRTISGSARVLHGGDGQVTELAHGYLSEVLGTPAEVARSSRFRINLDTTGLVTEVSSRAAMRGTFHYTNRGPA